MKHSWKYLSHSPSFLSPFHPSSASLHFLATVLSTHTHSWLPAQSQLLPRLCALWHSHLPHPWGRGCCLHAAMMPPTPVPFLTSAWALLQGSPWGAPGVLHLHPCPCRDPHGLFVLHSHGDEGMSAGTVEFGGCWCWGEAMETLPSSKQTSTSVSLKSPFLAEDNRHMLSMVCKEQRPDRAWFTQR